MISKRRRTVRARTANQPGGWIFERIGCRPGSGEVMEVGSTEVIARGEGERGAVLAHGVAYDTASWRDQARRISDAIPGARAPG